jgi:hypothetical protein
MHRIAISHPGCGLRYGTDGRSCGTPGRWTAPRVANRACAPMIAAAIGPQPGYAPGRVSQPSGPPHRVWARACARVVTDPECRALPGWKASSAAGSRPAPGLGALSRCGHVDAGSRLAGRDLVAWVRWGGLVAVPGEDEGSRGGWRRAARLPAAAGGRERARRAGRTARPPVTRRPYRCCYAH